MAKQIPISVDKLRAWHRERLGVRRASLPDARAVKATLHAVLAIAGLEGRAGLDVVYGEGGYTAFVSGDGGADYDAACAVIGKYAA